MTNARIMVVEDDAIISMDLANSLKKSGYEIAGVVATGEQALELARMALPDLVLMDIGLGGRMDGIEAAVALRSSLNIPVIFITAHTEDALLEKAKMAEPLGFIVKPFRNSELKSSLEMALYKAKSERQLRESEERLKDFMDNSTDLIQIVDSSGRFEFVNHAWRKVLGYSEEEVGGLSVFQIIHPDDRSCFYELFERVLSGERVTNVEAIFKTKQGTPVLVEGNVNCRYQDGRPISTRGIFRDITAKRKAEQDRRAAEQKVLQAKEEWERTFDAVPDLIMILDREHRITQINRAAAETLGVTKEQAVGSNCYELFQRSKASPMYGPDQLDPAGGREHSIEVCIETTGKTFNLTVSHLSDAIRTRSSTSSIGFEMKSLAPASTALRRSSLVFRMVTMTIGMSPQSGCSRILRTT